MQPLSTLNCFNHIEKISPMAGGLSSQCYRVQADNQCFFAKQIITADEPIFSINAAENNLSPRVIYHDQHWLITDFIEGENLSLSQQTINNKIFIATELMAKCHQLNQQKKPLLPEHIVRELLARQAFSAQQYKSLLKYSQSIIAPLKEAKITAPNIGQKDVFCHGDLNFSNILISKTNKSYLIDYECACIAPAEYDLAMFIAINNIDDNRITTSITHYKKHISCDIDPVLLNHYLRFCYFINGLWYQQAYKKSGHENLYQLTKQQFYRLDSSQNFFY